MVSLEIDFDRVLKVSDKDILVVDDNEEIGIEIKLERKRRSRKFFLEILMFDVEGLEIV